MPSRAALAILVAGVVGFFVVAPFVIAWGIFPGQYDLSALAGAFGLGAPFAAYVLVRVRQQVARRVQPYFSPAAPTLFVVVLAMVVAGFVLLPSLDALRIVRESARDETVAVRLINLHIVLAYLAATIALAGERVRVGARTLLVATILLSVSIALVEGRRTAAAIPLAVTFVIWMSQAPSYRAIAGRGALAAVAGLSLLVAVTAVRIGNFDDAQLVLRAVVTRAFNSGWMALEIVDQANFTFDPQTLSAIQSRLRYVLGLGEYVGRTNDFGVYYGFLASDNMSVGINPGIVVELWLSFGFAYLVAAIALFEWTLSLLRAFSGLLGGADAFAALLVVHGFQMEVPYTVGLLLRLTLAAVALAILRAICVLAIAKRVGEGSVDSVDGPTVLSQSAP